MKNISVLNYNDNCVCINVSPGKSLKVDPASYGGASMVPLTLDEIRYANNSMVFKSGILEFPEDIEDELYEDLRINKSKVLKLSEIRNILITPTKEGLTKLISINSLSDFDRVRGQFQKLKSEGYKLTLDIAEIIKVRTQELFDNQIKSEIKIGDADTPTASDNKKISELEKQLEEMKSLIASTLKSQTVSENPEPNKEVEPIALKKPGRPKKTTT